MGSPSTEGKQPERKRGIVPLSVGLLRLYCCHCGAARLLTLAPTP